MQDAEEPDGLADGAASKTEPACETALASEEKPASEDDGGVSRRQLLDRMWWESCKDHERYTRAELAYALREECESLRDLGGIWLTRCCALCICKPCAPTCICDAFRRLARAVRAMLVPSYQLVEEEHGGQP